jgi:hypothetical protein
MLSKLPIYLSFRLTQPQFKELIAYSRFPDYLNTWFEQTSQLGKVRLLYTPANETMREYRSNLMILDSQFFTEYPTSLPKPKGPKQESDPIGDAVKEEGAQPEAQVEVANPEAQVAQPDALEDGRVLRPVSITVMRTKWLLEPVGM